jgi:hypothetical protein
MPRGSSSSCRQLVLVNHAVLHDELQVLLRVHQDAEIGQWVAFDHQQVSIGALGDGAERALLHQQFGIGDGGRAQDVGRRVAAKDGFAVPVENRNLSFDFASGELYGYRVTIQCGVPALLTGQIKMQLRQAAVMGVNFSPSGMD